MVDDLNSPSPTKKKSPTSLSSSGGVKKKKKDVEVEVEEPPPLRSVHSPNLTSLPLVNYSQDMELQAQKLCSSYDESDDDDDDDDYLLTRPTVGSSDSSWAAAENANLANLEK